MMAKIAEWLGKAERTLDAGGRPAWLAAMVAGFILVWPVGLALLGYMIWSGRMSCWSKRNRRSPRFGSTGNTAFDEYREATLRRLEDEQDAFKAFLERLRKAKDQAEFDEFMKEKGSNGGAEPVPA